MIMKKIYLLAGVLAGTFAVNAQLIQTNTPTARALSKKGISDVKSVKATPAPKVEGEVVWSSDFTNASDWTITNAAPHTMGNWAIVGTMPTSLSSQSATYGFPASMNSASGGNFALVNSDGAGASGVQNAFLTTSGTIDLSAYGDTAFYVKFTEIYRHFYDENYLQVSNDNGATWTEFAVNPVSEVPVNTNSANPEYEVINITNAIGGGTWSSQVKIRFRYVGNYDWFWAIDDVELVQANNHDMKLSTVFQKTPAGTQELDYYTIDNGQTSFPGLVFKGAVSNFGNADQADVVLNATSTTGGYDATSASKSVDRGQNDTLEILEPFIPTGVGPHTINFTTELATNTDSEPANNQKSMVVNITNYEFGRDNGTLTGSIGNVSSQPEQPLRIGNLMEIFNDVEVTGIKIRLTNQAAIADQEIFGSIYLYSNTAQDFIQYAQSENIVLTPANVNQWVTLPLEGGATLSAGDLILLMAGHFGGEDEVRFGMAQPVEEGTVLGYTDDGQRFQLLSPTAIMIRLSDEPSTASLTEKENNFGLNVYPNPANDQVTVDFKLDNTASVNVSVTDLTGKVVYTSDLGSKTSGDHKLSFNTAAFSNGIYMINFNANNATSTQKLVIKK